MRALALALATMAIAPTTASATVMTMTGTNCHTAYGEDQTLYGDDGALYNAAPTWWRTALCPLPVSTMIYSYWVNAYDRHNALDVSCRVVHNWSNYVTWSSAITTSGSSSQKMTIGVNGLVGNFGTFSNLLCYLPQTHDGYRSGVLGYSYETVLF